MPSLFEPQIAQEIEHRIQQLKPNSERKWGTMSAAQMMVHVRKALQTGIGNKKHKKKLLAVLLGPLIKKMVLSPKPYKENLPTNPNFVISDEKDFDEEKSKLLNIYHQFIEAGATAVEGKTHPLFGKLTAEQWGYSQWKHFDHHLRQFGV